MVKFDLKNKIKKYDALNIHSRVRNKKMVFFFSISCDAPLDMQKCSCIYINLNKYRLRKQLRKISDKICSKMNKTKKKGLLSLALYHINV